MTKEAFEGKVISVTLRTVGDNKVIYDCALAPVGRVYVTLDAELGEKALALSEMPNQPTSKFDTTHKKVPKKDGDGFWDNYYLNAIKTAEPAASANGATTAQAETSPFASISQAEKDERIARGNAVNAVSRQIPADDEEFFDLCDSVLAYIKTGATKTRVTGAVQW